MKALAIIFTLLISATSLTASHNDTHNKDKGKKNSLREAVTAQVNRHLFFLVADGEKVAGEADVMLQVMPEGDVQVVLIQTNNPLIRKFIERQVRKMKIDKKEFVAGEILKYRFVFKAHN